MSTDRAVLFDVDGVLVDSATPHYESWRWVAAELGREMSRAEFDQTFGRTSRDIMRHFFGDRFDADEIEAIDARKEARFREIVADAYPLMPGAAALVESLREAGFRLGLGSSGPRENVELAARHLPPPEQFAAVITGHDVQRGKPDPQVFLLGAEALGLPPERCVVVEDAVAGVQAAKAGGMKVVALAADAPKRALLEAEAPDLVVDHLSQLDAEVMDRLLRPAEPRDPPGELR